jgi:MtN3 and saliva related transmembrane protein
MTLEYIFGIIALVTSLVGLLPQVWKTYRTQSAHDISMLMLVNYLVCSIAWIIHGWCQKASFVVWSNLAGLLISLVSILQKYYYDRKSHA